MPPNKFLPTSGVEETNFKESWGQACDFAIRGR
jgi:hypothetical protein